MIITIVLKKSVLKKAMYTGLNRMLFQGKVLNNKVVSLVIKGFASLLMLSSVFGMAFADDSKDDGPVFDVIFTDLTTGEKTQFYTKPDRIFHIPEAVTQSYEEVQALEAIAAQAEVEKALMATFLLEQGVNLSKDQVFDPIGIDMNTADVQLALEELESDSLAASSTATLQTLVYVNGMNNTPVEARLNLNTIKTKVAPRVGVDMVYHAWNQKEGRLEELAEVAMQHIQQDYHLSDKKAWQQFAYIFMSPKKYVFERFAKESLALIDEDNYINDVDLNRHLNEQYLPLLEQNHKVVILSHSQGNFYANRAWNKIENTPATTKYSQAIGVVGVATPAIYVADNGLYTTNTNDQIINGIRAFSEPHLQPKVANVTHSLTWNDELGHSLANIYLGDTSESHVITNKIANDINTTFARLTVAGSCTAFHKNLGNDWVGYYNPGTNFTGKLEIVIHAYDAPNSISVRDKNHNRLFWTTNYFSGTKSAIIDYDENSMGTLSIAIGAKDSGDKWDLRINCIK
ncbi:hypothetical protein [Shewanella surugensis]|uniref:Alpha/beta hydrolase n=1 Tax=Shewanella surugensis TaxID=212020 RepID=A0ABT0LFC4_9GAMM|nr:hypothetical protein [Shewanella surugensis]MCL1126407.1 hypothetical protein [Shewanella surugensis]